MFEIFVTWVNISRPMSRVWMRREPLVEWRLSKLVALVVLHFRLCIRWDLVLRRCR